MMRTIFIELNRPKFGGGQLALISLLRKLDKSRVTPIVVCHRKAGILPLLQMIGVKTYILSQSWLTLKRNTNLILLTRSIWSLIMPTIKLIDIIRKESIDIIYANNVFSFITALPAAKLSRVPIILVIHSSGLVYRAKYVIKQMAKAADAIVAVTQSIHEEFNSIGSNIAQRVITIYNGIDVKCYKPSNRYCWKTRRSLGIRDDEIVIGVVARLAKEKGIGCLIAASPHIIQFQPNSKFLIVGDGDERVNLEKMAHMLSTYQYFIFTGFQEEVSPLIAAMDMVVLPSQTEAHPRALLEAMAMEKPVVASDVGGIREVLKHGSGGFLVPPDEPVALATAIISMCRLSSSKRRNMGKYNRKCIERDFRIEDTAQRTQLLLQNLLKQSFKV